MANSQETQTEYRVIRHLITDGRKVVWNTYQTRSGADRNLADIVSHGGQAHLEQRTVTYSDWIAVPHA